MSIKCDLCFGKPWMFPIVVWHINNDWKRVININVPMFYILASYIGFICAKNIDIPKSLTSIDRVAGGFQLEFARYNTNWGYDRPNLQKLAFEFEFEGKKSPKSCLGQGGCWRF